MLQPNLGGSVTGTRYAAAAVPDNNARHDVCAPLGSARAVREPTCSLTDAQRLNDDYREGAGHLLVSGRLHANLEGVLRANTVIREAAVDCLRLIAELPGNRSAPSTD